MKNRNDNVTADRSEDDKTEEQYSTRGHFEIIDTPTLAFWTLGEIKNSKGS